jgi:hypothetical protein
VLHENPHPQLCQPIVARLSTGVEGWVLMPNRHLPPGLSHPVDPHPAFESLCSLRVPRIQPVGPPLPALTSFRKPVSARLYRPPRAWPAHQKKFCCEQSTSSPWLSGSVVTAGRRSNPLLLRKPHAILTAGGGGIRSSRSSICSSLGVVCAACG